MLEAALYSSFLYDCFGFLMKQGHILKEKIITHIREYLCDNRMRMLMNDFCNFKHTGEALLGGFRIVTPKWTPFWVRITGQEVLKDELQKLKASRLTCAKPCGRIAKKQGMQPSARTVWSRRCANF